MTREGEEGGGKEKMRDPNKLIRNGRPEEAATGQFLRFGWILAAISLSGLHRLPPAIASPD